MPRKTLKPFGVFIAIIALLIVFLGSYQVRLLNAAHSTFNNYYAFRGCTKLLDKTDTEGTCELASGQTIKIVKFNNKWFLDGDLPTCWRGFLCF